MSLTNELDRVNLLLGGKPFSIEWRVWQKYQERNEDGEGQNSTDNMKPFP